MRFFGKKFEITRVKNSLGNYLGLYMNKNFMLNCNTEFAKTNFF